MRRARQKNKSEPRRVLYVNVKKDRQRLNSNNNKYQIHKRIKNTPWLKLSISENKGKGTGMREQRTKG